MKQLFNAIKNYLLPLLNQYGITFIEVWNNNLSYLEQGRDNPNYQEPALFVEFVSPLNWRQLGNGVQTIDDLHIRLHIIHNQLDAMDGTMSQNLDVLQMAQDVFSKFEDSELSVPVGIMTRMGEMQDDDHDNVYHFQQEYITTWMDFTMNRPLNGTLSVPVLDYELDLIPAWSNAGMYVVGNYVSYLQGTVTSIYICIQDTTSAHEPPTNSSFFNFVENI